MIIIMIAIVRLQSSGIYSTRKKETRCQCLMTTESYETFFAFEFFLFNFIIVSTLKKTWNTPKQRERETSNTHMQAISLMKNGRGLKRVRLRDTHMYASVKE
jgi:hypothetical protein